jgi:hypothetical protein
LVSLIVDYTDSNADEIALALSLHHQYLGSRNRHPLHRLQKLPLVRIGPKSRIEEDTIPCLRGRRCRGRA